jgi:adenylate cyclase
MEAPELERRLAAILAADVEEYSRLMHNDEETTMSTLSARRAVVDTLIAEHRGRIANTAGDSVLAEFVSVLEAMSCAVAIQHAMDQANAGAPDNPMRFRIGINVGDVMIKDGDLFGDGVNVAARLEGLADGGGICVSRGVRDHLRSRANFLFEDLGEQLVKNIAHPIRAYRLRRNGETFIPEPPSSPDTELSAHDEVALELALWESVKDGGPAELASYLEHYPEGTFASLARTRQNAGASKSLQADGLHPDMTPDALDLAFWDAIKDSQTPEELTAYLERHPDGHFAALARAHLQEPHDSPAKTAEASAAEATEHAIELAFWEGVRDAEDAHLLAAYLEKYPDGEFAIIARSRIESRSGPEQMSSDETADRQNTR